MSSERRIITVSSGKGGVGKTTFAMNYALSLSQHRPTVLVDLDTGTSSVRNCIDTPVERDLYHFFRKGALLGDCVTRLDRRLDPEGHYHNFGFVAAPKHFMEDIANLTHERREQLIDAINGLKAGFVVLDLKAGLDASVIEFLPFANSGILVFTPHLPSATLAAADIVKAILFRKLRVLFASGSPVYQSLPGMTPKFVNALIDRVEDVYDSSVHNLDAFIADLHHALGDHPVVKLVSNAVDSFFVHYVLNRFNGIRTSYETAVRPFAESLAENVSGHLTILNLGWVVEHDKINEANIRRIPALLHADARAKPAASGDSAMKELERLAALHLPGRPARPERPKAPLHALPGAPKTAPTAYLELQLQTLRRMYEDTKNVGFRENFKYITSRTLHVMSSRRVSEFGDVRLYKASELPGAIHGHMGPVAK